MTTYILGAGASVHAGYPLPDAWMAGRGHAVYGLDL
jgi:hypothetical protein